MNKLWKLTAGLCLAALLGVGCASQPDSKPLGGNVGQALDEAASPEPCINQDEAVSAATLAGQALTDASHELQNANIDGAVVDLGLAADYTRDAAVASEGVPEAAEQLYAAADGYQASADALASFDLDTALDEMQDANRYMNAATAAVELSNAPAC